MPISITAIGGAEIDRRGLAGGADLLRGLPGVNQTEGSQGQSIIIRGIENRVQSQNYYFGATVATFFGETPTSSAAGLNGGTAVDLKLVDIERVEVLRGPQGTAFGSAALAGAVRVIPAAPRLGKLEGRVSAGAGITTYSGAENYNFHGVVNVPLGDVVAIRAVGYQMQDSGFVHNRAGSDPAFQSSVVVPYGAEAFARDENSSGESRARGARISALIEPAPAARLTLSYLKQKSEIDGSLASFSAAGRYDQTMFDVDRAHVVRGETSGVTDMDIDLATATAEFDLGWADAIATYSHISSGSDVVYPYTVFGAGTNVAASAYSTSKHKEDVGEIRLVTKFESGPNFLAGGFIGDLDDTVFYDERWFGAPAANIYAPGQTVLGIFTDDRTEKQRALFGEVTWEIVPKLTLTGGIRGYRYERTMDFSGNGPFWAAPGATLDVQKANKASGTSVRANASYKPSEDTMLYAGFSQGFRLGQLQRGLPPGRCDVDNDGIVDGTNISIASTAILESDNVDNYEVGVKAALFDRRLRVDASAFRMDWDNVPVSVRPGDLATTCGLIYTTNAGTARSEGVELQGSFQATREARVDFSAAWTHARLAEGVPAINAPRGSKLPGSPGFNASLGFQYDIPVGDNRVSLRTDATYVGRFYGDLVESPNLRAGDYVKFDLSARATLGQAAIDVYVRNLTNEDAFTFRGVSPAAGPHFGYRLRPRTFGAQLTYQF